MKIVIVLATVLGVAFGANHMCWSLDRIAQELVAHTDSNHDGIVQEAELMAELLMDWGLSLDLTLSYHSFTTNWMRHFHDEHSATHGLFVNLDLNGDNKLSIDDITHHLDMFDTSPADGQIQISELTAFLHAVHPDSHGNGGSGHGC